MSIILVWSVVVDVMSASGPVLLSFRVDWLIVLGGIGAGVSSGVDGCVSSSVITDIGSSVGCCIDTGVRSSINGGVTGDINGCILLSVVLIWSVVVNVVSLS